MAPFIPKLPPTSPAMTLNDSGVCSKIFAKIFFAPKAPCVGRYTVVTPLCGLKLAITPLVSIGLAVNLLIPIVCLTTCSDPENILSTAALSP